MITAQKVNVVAREAVGDIDRRVGRKGTYFIGAIVLLVIAFLLFRLFRGGKEAPPSAPPRPVAVAKV
ncbi:MAG: hypothetical protein ACREF8_05340, partial [Chthoniobacterales bacterium]